MNTYRISNTRSAHQFGLFQADSELGALNPLAQQAGYDNYEEARRIHDPQLGEVLVELVTDPQPERACRVCGCTDDDCSACIERTGEPCHWVELDLCSACVG